MNETLYMLLAFIAGAALGVLFFGGLWLTVKKAFTSKLPAIWFLGSFILRITITLAGFYCIGVGNWLRLLMALCGFVRARFIIIKLTKKQEAKHSSIKKGAGYAD